MPRLVLKFDDRVLQEAVLGWRPMRIGRLPDNTVVIDNPAVSGHHARVILEDGQAVLEDLHSTNGTFVNEKPITRHILEHGDVVLIGKHTLLFDQLADDVLVEPESLPEVPELGGTVMLDTRHHRDLMAKLAKEPSAPPAPAAPRMETVRTPKTETDRPPAIAAEPKTTRTPAGRAAVLHVLSGRTEQSEYAMTSHTSLIGKSDTALVRLTGWFKPKVAVAIARKGDTYSATSIKGKATINGRRLEGRHDLKEGDVIEVSGLTLAFRYRG